jgi:FRG domain.
MRDMQDSRGPRPESLKSASFLYRGIGCASFPLSPRFDRLIGDDRPVRQTYQDMIEEFERIVIDRSLMLEEFKYMHGYVGRRSKFVYEAVAQHRGVPTRLLDWSRSPYVAAFFAFTNTRDCSTGNVCIWALDVPYSQRVFRPEDFEVIDSYVPKNYRQLYQQGAFTINDTMNKGTEDLFGPGGPFEYAPTHPILFKHILPIAEKDVALEDLMLMRIDHTTLFPDMDGIAAFLMHKYFPDY